MLFCAKIKIILEIKSKYDQLYNQAVDFRSKLKNPCKIKEDSCLYHKYNNSCCHSCEHLDPQKGGCTTNSLTCRLWYCYKVWRTLNEKQETKLSDLLTEVENNSFHVFRGSRKQSIISHVKYKFSVITKDQTVIPELISILE